MYLQNKYTSYYYSIIDRAKSRILGKTIACEKHHIIPKSFGGSDSIENIAKLTLREHFFCHLLLTRMTEGKQRTKMVYALWMMCRSKSTKRQKYKVTSKIYQQTKLLVSKVRTSDDFTTEWRKKISESNKGKVAWNKGIPRTKEVKDAVSKANKGKEPWNRGITCNPSTAKKIKDSNTGKRWIHDDSGQCFSINPSELLEFLANGWKLGQGKRKVITNVKCQHCGKISDMANHTRWHGDKCRDILNYTPSE